MAVLDLAKNAERDKKSLTRPEPAVIAELEDKATVLSRLSGEPCGAGGSVSLRAQAALLDDPRLQTAQRRALAVHIGRTQGNRYVQRSIALVRDPSLRERHMSAAEADTEIRRALVWMVPEWAREGRTGRRHAGGHVSIVDEDDFWNAYDEEYPTLEEKALHPYDGLDAFIDRRHHAWIHRERGTVGTLIHEALHLYSVPSRLEDRMGEAGKEGMTEYFTVQICQQMGIERVYAPYVRACEAVRLLAHRVGREWVRRAFFMDEITALGHELDRTVGQGAFFLWCRRMKAYHYDSANQVIRGRRGEVEREARIER